MAEKGLRGRTVEHLRAWRMHRVLNQSELATAAGVGRTTVLRGEAGHIVNFANIRKLAAALGITPEQLLREGPEDKEERGAA